jgi:hypothetical protein
MGMVRHTYNPSTQRLKQENWELRLPWATQWDPISERERIFSLKGKIIIYTAIKWANPKEMSSGSLWIVEHMDALEGSVSKEGMETPCPFPNTCLSITSSSVHWYPFWKTCVSLSSVSHRNRLIKPKQGVEGNPIHRQSHLRLVIDIWSGEQSWGLSLSLRYLMLSPGTEH